MFWLSYCIYTRVAISWKNYPTSPFFDEYLNTSQGFRTHTKKIGKFLGSLRPNYLNEINNGDVVALIGDYDPVSISYLIKLSFKNRLVIV